MKGFWGPSGSLSAIAASVKSGAAAVTAQVTAPTLEKPAQQYLRLPIESARRLKWFESKEMDAIVKEHTLDKQVLVECITALRMCMVEYGIEVRHLSSPQPYLVDASRQRTLKELCFPTCLRVMPCIGGLVAPVHFRSDLTVA